MVIAVRVTRHSLKGGAAIQVLLVLPRYYTRYPALGLLKISSFHKHRGDEVEFHDSLRKADSVPSKIYITSLFTYSWKPVHDAAEFYRRLYPDAEIVLGGIYATLMPEHAGLADVDSVHVGLLDSVERYMPDYSLVPEWKSSIMFGTRGCIANVRFVRYQSWKARSGDQRRALPGWLNQSTVKWFFGTTMFWACPIGEKSLMSSENST